MVSLPRPGRVIAVNVGRIEEIAFGGRVHRTAIRKRPVDGPRALGPLGVDGDVQGDRRVHGGVDKAVYGYASEHHPFWAETLGEAVGPGAFGENLTTGGLLEDEVRIGDRFRMGGALLEVSQPRQPCSTFAAYHQRADLPKLFGAAGRPGIYFRVVEAGELAAGDAVERVARGEGPWTVRQVYEWVMGKVPLPDDLDDVLAHPALADATRRGLEKRRAAAG